MEPPVTGVQAEDEEPSPLRGLSPESSLADAEVTPAAPEPQDGAPREAEEPQEAAGAAEEPAQRHEASPPQRTLSPESSLWQG